MVHCGLETRHDYLIISVPILQFWNWWQFRKAFYWFSPEPCPVEWYEYFFVVLIVVAFSSFMEKVFVPIGKRFVNQLMNCSLKVKTEEEELGECLSQSAEFFT